jgi:hypothetical protein
LYLKAVDKTAFLHKYGNEVNVWRLKMYKYMI